jgi:hypothetical protein
MAVIGEWPPTDSATDELPARLSIRLQHAGIAGIREVGLIEQSDGLLAHVAVFPLTGDVEARIAEVCLPFPSSVSQGSEQPARRC